MLFNRVFNWIKYKTLPPSILFLNRLFVERDSKHRRLTSNLGLTFRNSKWSMYARTNISEINHAGLYTAFLTIIGFVLTLLLVYSMFTYYDLKIVINSLLVNLWFIIDFELYITTLGLFIYWFATHTVLTVSYTQLFDLRILTSNLNHNHECLKDGVKIQIPKRLYKSILYKWSSTASSTAYDSIYFKGSTYVTQGSCQKLYNRLFKLVKLLINNANTVNYYSSVVHCCNPNSSLITEYMSKVNVSSATVSKYSYKALLTDYAIRYLNHKVTKNSSEFTFWNLDLTAKEWTRTLSEIPLQPFYLRQISYTYVNHSSINNREFSELVPSLEFQTMLRSIHKWMYKYNLLHRTALQDSTQTTFLLQHLAPSFYASTFFSRNMWTSSTLSSTPHNSLNVGSYHEALGLSTLMYGDNQSLQSNSLFRNFQSISQVTFFPVSYNWMIQRFYKFSTLESHRTNWNRHYRTDFNNSLMRIDSMYSNTLLQFFWQLNKCQCSYLSPLTLNFPYSMRSYEWEHRHANANVYLSYVDYNIFSKLNAEIGLNVISNQGAPVLLFYSLQPIHN